MKKLCVWAVAALLMAACTPKAEKATDSGLLQSNFRTEVDGKKTDLYILRNKNNMEVCITNFGGRIVSVMVPDKDGQMRDVVLGFDSIQDYISSDILLKYDTLDMNVYQCNMFHSRMLIKELELQNYLFKTDVYELDPKVRLDITNRLRREMIEIYSGMNIY